MSSVQIRSELQPQQTGELNNLRASSLESDTIEQGIEGEENTSNHVDDGASLVDQRAMIPDNDYPSSAAASGPIRVPGTYPPEWLPDHETDTCMACDTLFTLIKRRHHCRSCGKIFCADCCRQKAKLLYLDNKDARVCGNCYSLLQYTLINPDANNSNNSTNIPTIGREQTNQSPSSSSTPQTPSLSSGVQRVGVLKLPGSQTRATNPNECNTVNSSPLTADQQQLNKQVIFADGIRPGTDLSESFPHPVPSSSSSSDYPSTSSFSLLTRQNRSVDDSNCSNTKSTSKKNRNGSKSHESLQKNITVCDELGYLPPIVISKHSSIATMWNDDVSNTEKPNSSLTSLIASQFKPSGTKKSIQASMESRNCPLNGVIKFEEISSLVGLEDVVTFLLLKDYYLKVKLITKPCCFDKKIRACQTKSETELVVKDRSLAEDVETVDEILTSSMQKEDAASDDDVGNLPHYWCFTSSGLARFGQSEIVLIIDKERGDACIPRDVFKIYLTLHELALRRQSLESLGNLLFQDGLFGNRDTAGLLFVRPVEEHCLNNLVVPDSKNFLFALVLQRWEVPWSKVFPMRLLLRLGYQFETYPYPLISLRMREPVYYEVGHTIISILGDFRNFRYSITHVDGLRVLINKTTRKVLVQLHQSCYQQFNKVLDSSNNEHVLAWSCCPCPGAKGHLVSVQNEDGQYETVEFLKKNSNLKNSFEESDSDEMLGASFIIFSGALKVNQSGQSAKISIVEDGLLIQIQSCTMSALKNSIHFMHDFDIDCENNQDPLNRVEIDWQLEDI